MLVDYMYVDLKQPDDGLKIALNAVLNITRAYDV